MVLPFDYWPSLYWMKNFLDTAEVQVEQWGAYQKQSGANRCKIWSDKGLLTLSVPLIGGREQKTLLREVKIDNTQRWAIQHIRSIKSCYGKAPFFDHYFPLIEKVVTQRYERLIDLNHTILLELIKWLRLRQQVELTDSFMNATIHPKAMNNLPFKPYVQVFSNASNFSGNLSVIDALLCLGPDVPVYLKQQAT